MLVRDENVISRDEERGLYKSLAHFFNDKDPHVVIVDDRTDVWKDDALYVIQITPFEWPADNAPRKNDDLIAVQYVFDTLHEIFASKDTTFVETLRRVIHHREQEAGPNDEKDAEILKALAFSTNTEDDA